MGTMTSRTFKLKEIYDEASFVNVTTGKVKNYYPNLNNEDSKLAMTLVYNRYADSEVAFDTPGAFARNLFIVAIDVLPSYVTRLARLRRLNELTLDELIDQGHSIMNSAQNPNDRVNDPLNTVLDYISDQTTTSTTGNKYDSLQDAIRNANNTYTTQFVNRFSVLFVKIYAGDDYEDYLYKKEN